MTGSKQIKYNWAHIKKLQVERLTWCREKFKLSGLSGLVWSLWPASILYRIRALP